MLDSLLLASVSEHVDRVEKCNYKRGWLAVACIWCLTLTGFVQPAAMICRTPATRRTPQQASPAAETPGTAGTADKSSAQQQQSPAAGPSGSKPPAEQSAAAGEGSEKQQRRRDAAAADGGEAPQLGELVNEGYSLEPSVRELQVCVT